MDRQKALLLEKLRQRQEFGPGVFGGEYTPAGSAGLMGIRLWVKTDGIPFYFGVGAPPILVHFSGDLAVHWGYGVLTHVHPTIQTASLGGPINVRNTKLGAWTQLRE